MLKNFVRHFVFQFLALYTLFFIYFYFIELNSCRDGSRMFSRLRLPTKWKLSSTCCPCRLPLAHLGPRQLSRPPTCWESHRWTWRERPDMWPLPTNCSSTFTVTETETAGLSRSRRTASAALSRNFKMIWRETRAGRRDVSGGSRVKFWGGQNP